MIMAKNGESAAQEEESPSEDNVLVQLDMEEKHRSAHKAAVSLK